MKKDLSATPVVVTPLDNHMGVDIARSLGRRGIPVYGIDHNPRTPGRASRYAQLVVSPDWRRSRQEYIRFLLDFGHKLGRKAVLYGLSDNDVLLISEAREQLSRYYEIVMPSHCTIMKLLTKDGLHQVAQECGIPAPMTVYPQSVDELEETADQLEFPMIIKPTESLYWHKPEIAEMLRASALSGHAKVVLCKDKNELLNNYRKIAAYDDRMIVQEVLPGEDSQLVYFASYTNRNSETVAYFAGRKIRIIPVGFGSASYVQTMCDPELISLSLRLLYGVKYQGPSGIEFKYDSRDHRYKLVEVNARFGMWDGLSTKIGIDLPYVAYRDAIGQPLEPRHSYPEGVIWVDYFRDLRAFLAYHKMGKISLGEWLRSLRGDKMVATFSWDDPSPLIFTGLNLFGQLVRNSPPYKYGKSQRQSAG